MKKKDMLRLAEEVIGQSLAAIVRVVQHLTSFTHRIPDGKMEQGQMKQRVSETFGSLEDDVSIRQRRQTGSCFGQTAQPTDADVPNSKFTQRTAVLWPFLVPARNRAP